MTYQNAFNAGASNSEGAYDRARGGEIELKLTIPSKTLTANGACDGTITTKEMKVTIIIDVEKLPVVNVAGYLIEEEQTGPDSMDHPGPLKVEHTFS